MASPLNPVEQRLLYLCDLWSQFIADPAKRLLVWQVQDNAARIVHCFFAAQKHESPYATADMFIVFDAPFENSLQYARAVKAALLGQYQASRDDLIAQGLEADWAFEPDQLPDTAAGVLEALRSFGSKYHRSIQYLAAVFTPAAISNAAAFSTWLARASSLDIPERLRLVTLDCLESPQLSALSSQHPKVCLQQPAIDGVAVAQETFAQEKTFGSAGIFRNLMMGVMALVEKGSADEVQAKAADALAFARKQHWLDQEIVLRSLVAGALLKESRHDEAVRVYQSARAVAQSAIAENHPAGRKLLSQTWFGEAGAQLAAGDARAAAACYDSATTVAYQDEDTLMAIESLRMSGCCFARSGEGDCAQARFGTALDMGQRLKPEARGMTTLPFAAVDWLRVIDADRVAAIEKVAARVVERRTAAFVKFENEAGALADTSDAGSLEHACGDECMQAGLAGEVELDSLVTAAPPLFRAAFARGRELLGETWPLDNPLKVGAAPADVAGVRA